MPTTNTLALPSPALAKLAKVLNLLSSSFPGERAAAALVAARMVQTLGSTWEQILAPVTAPPPPPVAEREPPLAASWRTTCALLAKRHADLRPWERQFVASLPAFPRISKRQRCVLGEIANRVLERRF
jgi:hypothetical protein